MIINKQREITISLPDGVLVKISEVIEKNPIYEDHLDFIIHAITDLLEECRINETLHNMKKINNPLMG